MSSPVLALDLGLRRTGVALSETGQVVQPLTTLTWKPPHAHTLIRAVLSLVQEHEAQTVVIGIPYLNGEETDLTARIAHLSRRISEALAELPKPPQVVYLNEAHSSQDGEQQYPDVNRDAAAAAILLTDYLDTLS